MAFSKIIGQKEVKNRLGTLVTSESAQSFLINAPQGMGKHVIGEELSKALLCKHPSVNGACDNCPSCTYFDAMTHPDMKRIEAPKGKKSIKISDLRSEVISDSAIVSQISARKVYLINADHLNVDSQNCLLKSLEEPPKGVTFILLCSDSSKLLGTILSRVLEIRIAPYKEDEIVDIIRTQESSSELSENRMKFLASFSACVPGKAISLMSDDVFAETREFIFDEVMKLPSIGVSDLLIDEYAYYEKNKDRIGELLLLLEWTLGDIAVMLASPKEGQIKNSDKIDELKDFIRKNTDITLINVSNCIRAINDFAESLRVNASFDGACSSMLLKIYKELKR